nr:DUF3265 domain-containing protein [Vibrio galatheae]
MTRRSRATHNAWHFYVASNIVITEVCSDRCIALLTP